jgi:hypothetical protein
LKYILPHTLQNSTWWQQLLTRPQHQILTQLVFARLSANSDTMTISTWVGPEAVLRLPATTHVLQIAEWIVDTVLEQPEPGRLIHVIRVADNQQPGIESLLDLANRLEQEPIAWVPSVLGDAVSWAVEADPLTVADGGPFLDRLNFRQLLPRFGANLATPSCTLVSGDPGTGKTYLQDFCKSFAARRKDLAVGYSKLGSSGLKDFPPRIPAVELAQGLGTDLTKAPTPHADQHRDAKNLAAWIAAYTPLRRVPALAILDDFGATELNEAVHTLVLELVRLIQTDDKAKEKLRVVLLGYDPQRLTNEGLQYEPHILEYVDTSHIEQWLRLRFPGHAEYRYQGAIEALEAQQVPARGSTRLRTLNTLVQLISGQFQTVGP